MAILFSDFVDMCNLTNDQITTLTAQANDLTNQLATAVADKQAVLQQLANAQSQCSQMTQQITSDTTNIATLTTSNTTLAANNTTLTTQLTAANASLQTSNANLVQANQTVASLQTQITTLNSTIAGLQAQIYTLNNAVTTLQTQVAILQSQLLAAKAIISNTTVSLASLTAHNVSTSPNYNKTNFPTLFTGITHQSAALTPVTIDSTIQDDSQNPAAPMNVSKVSLHTLMPKTWTGKIINYMQAWWGFSNHPNIGFSNTNATDVARIMDDSASRGFDVVCPDWYGNTFQGGNDQILDLIAQNCARTNQTFCIMVDEQYLKDNGYVTATYQQGLVTAFNHFASKYFTHPQYELVGGRPLLLLWGMASLVGTSVDWAQLKTQIQGNPLIIQYQSAGFSVPASDGSLFWVDPNADSAAVPSGTTYLTSSAFPSITANPSKIAISSAFVGFNGTLTKSAAWSDGKFMDRRNGQTWLDWWKTNNDFVTKGNKLDYIGVITDDFQEGTSVQGGIRNDIAFTSVSIVGRLLSWAVTGTETTVSSYDIYMSTDGTNGKKIASLPSTTKSLDLTSYNVPVGATIYAYCVGQPSIQNHLSNGVVFNG